MKEKHADITIVLDKSGSMNAVRADTIGSFNQFLESQKDPALGTATVTMLTFNERMSYAFQGDDVQKVQPLTTDSYRPGGMTALLDAVGKAITDTGERLAALAEEERPDRVLIAIITDGRENSSKEHTREQIKEMVERQQNEWKWQFAFLGANVDAFSEAGSMGIAASATMSYESTPSGVKRMASVVGQTMSAWRSSDKPTDYSLPKK